ncbi:hypothetical protein AAFC00_003940 [Neodothiora populina]
MQLVEQAKVELDDGEELEGWLHELKDKKVLVETDNGQLLQEEKNKNITLRMLLSHTAGFGYSFSSAKLEKWSQAKGGIDELTSAHTDVFTQPLLNQPDMKWEYGINMDWVGLLVERVSGLSLAAYFQEHIFTPLGTSGLTFFPDVEHATLAQLSQRDEKGVVVAREGQFGHVLQSPFAAVSEEQRSKVLCAGGHGLYGTPTEYCKILATILNHGVDPVGGARLLQAATVEQMLENQIPHQPNFARDLAPSAKPDIVSDDDETFSQPGDPPQGWGISFFKLLADGPHGWRKGTVWWSGVANLVWWIDMESGIAGMVAGQILPFGDDDFFNCQHEVESVVYEALVPRKA